MSEKEDKEGHPTRQLTRQQVGKHNHTERATTTTQTGPSPIPSPVGRGVITEIPLSACCSLLTVLFAVVSHVVLHSLYLI